MARATTTLGSYVPSVGDFKPDLSMWKKVDLIEIWKNPTVEGEIFFILSSLDNSKFMEILTLLHSSMMEKFHG
jgi:hypothetical protein